MPDRAIAGSIGEFWKLRDGERVAVKSREQFLACSRAGFALSTPGFHVDPEGSGSPVTTVTRVRTTDPSAKVL